MSALGSLAGERPEQILIQLPAGLRDVLAHGLLARPVFGHVRRQIATNRIDSESEQLIERRPLGRQMESSTAQQIPVEGLEMAQIEDQPMTLGNRPVVERVGSDRGENCVSVGAGLGQSMQQWRERLRLTARRSHEFTSGRLRAPN